jgi:putative ABC transport system permease protein
MQGLALIYNPKQYALLQVSYRGSFEAGGKTIEKAWSKVNPDLKVDYKDFSQEIHKMYNILFGDLADVLTVISFLAILISSLGLLGMATYTTETRRKEISIRKVLGSENGALVYLLSKGFFLILALAIIIAVPAAWFLNKLWLEKLAYHVNMDAQVILTGIFILIVFGVVTIGSQTWRAAFINPVESLKGE